MPLKQQTITNRLRSPLYPIQIQLLLKLPDTSKAIGQRNVAMLATLYATGARAQELCDITLKDITLATPSFPTKVRLTGKGTNLE
ncbi:site-specific integrase [Candidatus Contubernalis alkaliaceticus]|uniref:tyrosine-type recombinase/integrase n=1 Tax=Candidatus Contubernalis alkaliaceticus TaxID=338645 RepID=UPI002409E486|nr:tyrosine-type recombinase/integrase [Candidatus Contubernalis alkalaceticus]UNC92027.1 tyrosine-type recombinase/integrase [Candidatus Contubernalis alkalaceticus]